MLQKKIIGMLGIWLFLSAIVLQATMSNIINFLIVGIISAISGFTLTVKRTVEGWTGAILGLWLIISAFIASIETVPCKYCNAFIIGIIFIVIGFARFNKEEDPMIPNNYHHKIHTHRY